MNEWEWQLLEDRTRIDHLSLGATEVSVGDRVRLRPRQGGDVLDIALAGQTAAIESIEQDYEGNVHVCVVLDSDPGRDLGLLRQPGHRFFFSAAELEALPIEEMRARPIREEPRILVAGIGNIFFGDDGFGVEVVKRLIAHGVPAGVRVVDFGIRGFDLACALQDGYEATILVDSYPHGQAPGTVSLVEPDLANIDEPAPAVEPHAMSPLNVLRLATAMNVNLKKVLLVGCEPQTFGGEEGHMGLSEPVEAAVEEGANLVASVVQRILEEGQGINSGVTSTDEGERRV